MSAIGLNPAVRQWTSPQNDRFDQATQPPAERRVRNVSSAKDTHATAFPLSDPPQSPPTSHPLLEVKVNTFIPQEKAETPGLGTYAGDNRGVGEPGSHRTQQTIQVHEGNPPTVSVSSNIGATHKIDADGNVIKTGQASEDTVWVESQEVKPDGTIVVQLAGQSANPLVGVAPGITYKMTVEMKPHPDGTWTVNVDGKHDSFPGYEVQASVNGGPEQTVYGYDPRTSGSTPFALAQGDPGPAGWIWGDSREKVNSSQRVSQNPVTASEIVERNTKNGVVDIQALGADLAQTAEDGPVNRAYVQEVMGQLPPDQQKKLADAFFDNLTSTSGMGGPYHHTYKTLATSDAGMEVLLEMGKHAPDRLADPEVYRGMEAVLRGLNSSRSVHAGDPEKCKQAAELIEALAGHPEAQKEVAQFLEPIYDDDKDGMKSTPEGRTLENLIERTK